MEESKANFEIKSKALKEEKYNLDLEMDAFKTREEAILQKETLLNKRRLDAKNGYDILYLMFKGKGHICALFFSSSNAALALWISVFIIKMSSGSIGRSNAALALWISFNIYTTLSGMQNVRTLFIVLTFTLLCLEACSKENGRLRSQSLGVEESHARYDDHANHENGRLHDSSSHPISRNGLPSCSSVLQGRSRS